MQTQSLAPIASPYVAGGNVARALAFLRLHGNVMHASVTPDGIIATSWANLAACEAATLDNDEWFEETAVFPVVDGNTSMYAIRAWLGY